MNPTVPFVDLTPQNREIADEVRKDFDAIVASSTFIGGPPVERFEQDFAKFCGVKSCIGVANGTDALELAVRALGLGAGDEVLVPANSFIASALAVVRAGSIPVLVDCDDRYLLMDPEQVRRKITPRTRALMPVHLFGQMAPMDALLEIAKGARLEVIEDAAQSQGASCRGRAMGSWGRIAGTSFYPGKNLGAWGDAGAVLTNEPVLTEAVRALRNYGSDVKYHHPVLGFNSRLDPIQASVLSAKLRRLATWNSQRRALASRYAEALSELPGVRLPEVAPENEHVWHLYVVRVKGRDKVQERMRAAGVGTGVHYPVPMHLQGALSLLGYKAGDFPVAEQAARDMLSLPMFPGMTPEQQGHVVQALRSSVQ